MEAICDICGGPNDPARAEIGRTWCTTKSCIATWRNRRIQEKGLVLVTGHKQGPMWVTKDTDVVKNNGRRS